MPLHSPVMLITIPRHDLSVLWFSNTEPFAPPIAFLLRYARSWSITPLKRNAFSWNWWITTPLLSPPFFEIVRLIDPLFLRSQKSSSTLNSITQRTRLQFKISCVVCRQTVQFQYDWVNSFVYSCWPVSHQQLHCAGINNADSNELHRQKSLGVNINSMSSEFISIGYQTQPVPAVKSFLWNENSCDWSWFFPFFVNFAQSHQYSAATVRPKSSEVWF